VTRFPAGSPIHVSDDNPDELFTIATFNRPVTSDELIGKLLMVVYDESTQNVNLYEVPEDQPAQGVAMMVNGDESTEIRLIIDGTSLKLKYNSAGREVWIFDIDFDHQHRKNLELTEGFYYLEIPQLLNTDLDGPIYAVVRMSSSFADGIDILGTSFGDAVTYSTQTSSLDTAPWFNGEIDVTFLEVKVLSIFAAIINMEYHGHGELSIGTVLYDDTQDIAVDGSFNPFTDGSPYVPPTL